MPNENTTWVNALLCGPDMPTIALLDFDEHRRDRTHPGRDRTAADLRGDGAGERSGVRRSGRAAARTTGQAGRGDDGVGLDDDRCPVPVPDHPSIRDPVHGLGHRHRRRPRVLGQRRARSARPLLGRARLVVDGLGVERTASRRRHPRPWRRSTDTRRPAHRYRLHAAAGEALVELQGVTAEATFADNDLPASTTITYNPGDLVATIDIRGHAPVLLRHLTAGPVTSRARGQRSPPPTAAPVSAGWNGTATTPDSGCTLSAART